MQHQKALELILPGSNLYDYLEDRVPHPSVTYPKVIEIVEAEESKRINTLIGERKTRIGARIGQVTDEVKREVFRASNLEGLYQTVIDWSYDDDLRRMYEERLLQRAYDTLAVLLPKDKSTKRAQVQKLSQGMVILKRPFALAWKVLLEWQDAEEIKNLEQFRLQEYVEIFPDDGLAKIIQGFLDSEASPFPHPKEGTRANEETEEQDEPVTAEERLLSMTEGLEQSSRALLSQRLMSIYFLYLEEYANAVECSQKALDLLRIEQNISGLELPDSSDGISLTLATALIHHQSPRNHAKAHTLFKNILNRKPANSAALIGTGLILEEEEEFQSAFEFLSRALASSSDAKVTSEAAWCQALTGNYSAAIDTLKDCLSKLESTEAPNKILKSEVQYRIGQCMWNLESSREARKSRSGAYAYFLASLQSNLSFAPAYTALGVYYADYAKDKSRARKCFQKAFELSPAEVVAAERLARNFADVGDLDLVEIVSQRVIDSERARPPPGSKRKGLSWPFAALGVCQLNRQAYADGIVSFQAALRISSEDIHAWVGLGESYHNSGRFIAATKAFEQAQRLQDITDQHEDLWFSRYMLANVKRELGNFEDAAESYDRILLERPKEYGISIALLQTHVESAWQSIESGLFGRASQSCLKALDVATTVIKLRSSPFNLWKALGDTCSIFFWIDSYAEIFPVQKVKALLEWESKPETWNTLADIDGIGEAELHSLSSSDSITALITAALLAQKRAVYNCAGDLHAQAVAWYNLGWTEYRAGALRKTDGSKASQYFKAAVRCFKRAIELEAGNSEFWNSLGIVTTQLNPKVAQHSFVRSLHLNDRSATTWTNLGTLYLLQNDIHLANEAFTRGQSTDPEYAHAWLGQGVLALMLGEAEEAQSLFTQAFEISTASSVISKKLYSISSFDQILLSTHSSQIIDVLQPLFALHQLRSQRSDAVVFEHLSALFAERIGEHGEPISSLGKICTSLEAEYEESESLQSLARFAQAKADLGRAQLAASDFTEAIQNAETALDLSSEEESGAPDPSARIRYRLSAHLTCGLGYSAQGNMDEAITMFRTALEESEGSPDIVCVLAQVLWAKGGEEERSVVREQLFGCMEKHPDHASAIYLLAVIAIMDGDSETLEVVAADLQNLRIRDDLDEPQKLKIDHLLAAVARLDSASVTTDDSSAITQTEISEAATSIMLAPSATHGWSQLANLATREDSLPAEMGLLMARSAVPPRGILDAEALAKAYAATDIAADGQRAVMIAPWLPTGWRTLV